MTGEGDDEDVYEETEVAEALAVSLERQEQRSVQDAEIETFWSCSRPQTVLSC